MMSEISKEKKPCWSLLELKGGWLKSLEGVRGSTLEFKHEEVKRQALFI